MSKSVSVSKFREHFHEELETVEQGQRPVTLTRNGRPVAVILSAREYERLMDAFDLLYADEAEEEEYSEPFYL